MSHCGMEADSEYRMALASDAFLTPRYSFMDDISRVTAPDYLPTDCASLRFQGRVSPTYHLIQLIFCGQE